MEFNPATLEIEETLKDRVFIFSMPYNTDLDLIILSQRLTLIKNERISKASICREALNKFLNLPENRAIIENEKHKNTN